MWKYFSILFSATLVFGDSTGVDPKDDPDFSKLQFLLWTRANMDEPQVVELTPESLMASNFDSAHPTVILAHGWQDDGMRYGEFFAPSYLAVGEHNIFSINWGQLEGLNYLKAAATTEPVGKHSALLVLLLAFEAGAKMEEIHLVGHSLGAHVVGFLGKEVQVLGLGKVARVTGLDPAKPMFEAATEKGRIDKGDAEFVDIIHTNSGNLWDGCLSFPEALGHIDFYPGGGSHQPGCTEICFGATCTNATIDDLIKGGCSHTRANSYFRESIESRSRDGDEFVGTSCSTWEDWQAGLCCGGQEVVMGEWLDPVFPSSSSSSFSSSFSSSSFFLNVGEEAPYARGQEGLPDCGR